MGPSRVRFVKTTTLLVSNPLLIISGLRPHWLTNEECSSRRSWCDVACSGLPILAARQRGKRPGLAFPAQTNPRLQWCLTSFESEKRTTLDSSTLLVKDAPL